MQSQKRSAPVGVLLVDLTHTFSVKRSGFPSGHRRKVRKTCRARSVRIESIFVQPLCGLLKPVNLRRMHILPLTRWRIVAAWFGFLRLAE